MALWAQGRPQIGQRPQACMGCHSGCRARYKDASGNEACCFSTAFYRDASSLDIQRTASDLLNRCGLNASELIWGLVYIGILAFPYWGIPVHKEPRAQVYWGYGTLLGDRDIKLSYVADELERNGKLGRKVINTRLPPE